MPKRIAADEAARNLKNRTHKLTVEAARKMARKYQKFRKALLAARDNGDKVPADTPDMSLCYSFNKNSVQKLLAEKRAAGLRIYLAINAGKELTPVLVAFDKDGNNITHPALALEKSGSAGKKGVAKDKDDDDEGVLDDG